jgi:hypothetical protein
VSVRVHFNRASSGEFSHSVSTCPGRLIGRWRSVSLYPILTFDGFDGLRIIRDGETEFKVRSDLRALLYALGRYHGVKHVICTLGVLRDGEIVFKLLSDLRALFCALGRYHGVKHVLCTLRVLRDGEKEFKVHSDLRALLCALGRFHVTKHVLCTLGGLSFF